MVDVRGRRLRRAGLFGEATPYVSRSMLCLVDHVAGLAPPSRRLDLQLRRHWVLQHAELPPDFSGADRRPDPRTADTRPLPLAGP